MSLSRQRNAAERLARSDQRWDRISGILLEFMRVRVSRVRLPFPVPAVICITPVAESTK